MTSASPDEPAVPRRRRAVRPAGTVGGDEANLRSSFPAPPSAGSGPRGRRVASGDTAPRVSVGPSAPAEDGSATPASAECAPRPAECAPRPAERGRRPDEQAPRPDEQAPRPDERARRPGAGRRASDDLDVGWGRPGDDSNDDRLTRERPPHW